MDDADQKQVSDMIAAAIKTHRHDGVLTQRIYLTDIFGFQPRWPDILNLGSLVFTVGGVTNGMTPNDIILAGTQSNPIVQSPIQFQIIGFTVLNLDTTAGTITLKKNTTTIASVAKGTVPTEFFGATSINGSGTPPANDVFPGDVLSIVSSSAGNALVRIEILFPVPFNN